MSAAPSDRARRDAPTPRPTRYERERRGAGADPAEALDPKQIGPWKLGKTVGKGSSGRVRLAKHAATGEKTAVKIIPKAVIRQSQMHLAEAGAKADKHMNDIEREISVMKLFDHPNVMKMYDVWENPDNLYLILEFVSGGELFDYLVDKGALRPSEALVYFQQIIAGIDYCHRFMVAHRDLKPENVLLSADKQIKLADWGMAALQRPGEQLRTSCGSPHYASPEIVRGDKYDGAASDIWSCGVILYALLAGRLPFDHEHMPTLLSCVKRGRYVMPNHFPADAADLIRRMLVVDPARRITMPEILVHPFMNSGPSPYKPPVAPPSLDDFAAHVHAELDHDVVGNLRTLLRGARMEDVVRALMSEERNIEKGLYYLLVEYRERAAEMEAAAAKAEMEAAAKKAKTKALPARSARPQSAFASPGPKAMILTPATPGTIRTAARVAVPSPARSPAPAPAREPVLGPRQQRARPTSLAVPGGPRPDVRREKKTEKENAGEDEGKEEKEKERKKDKPSVTFAAPLPAEKAFKKPLPIATKSSATSTPFDPPPSPASSFLMPPPSPTMSIGSNGGSSPKLTSWFANMFWKSHTVDMYSPEPVALARETCKTILESLGVKVVVEDAESFGTLKCKTDEIREPNGLTTLLKPVRFRVEFTHRTSGSPVLGSATPPQIAPTSIQTALSLVLEKGAYGTFKTVHERLRTEFENKHNNAGVVGRRALPAPPTQTQTQVPGLRTLGLGMIGVDPPRPTSSWIRS